MRWQEQSVEFDSLQSSSQNEWILWWKFKTAYENYDTWVTTAMGLSSGFVLGSQELLLQCRGGERCSEQVT